MTMTKEQIAALLKDKRLENKLTGSEVVRRLELDGITISPKTLYGYERCISSPSIPIFLALCRIYEIEDVIAAVKDKPVRIALDAREERLVRYFRQASPEAQELVLKMLRPETTP